MPNSFPKHKGGALPPRTKKLPPINSTKTPVSLNKSGDFEFPDLLEDEPPKQKRTGSIRRSLQKPAPLGRNVAGLSGGVAKTMRDAKRDNMVKQIQTFNQKQIAASQPDPMEEKRRERAKLETAKMNGAVREILDDMMQTIVTEVSLKLGGAMHAQHNAIKNVVDSHIAKNPVISDRVQSVKEQCLDVIHEQFNQVRADLVESMTALIMAQMAQKVANEGEQLALAVEKLEGRIDQVRTANGANASVADDLRERIQTAERHIAAAPNDLEAAMDSTKLASHNFTESYCNEKFNALDAKIQALNELGDKIAQMAIKEAENEDKIKVEIEALRVKMDKGVKHADKHTDESIKKLQKVITDLEKKQKKGGGCIMM